MGSCTITASAGGATGGASLVILLDSVPGDPSALVADAIPDIRYRADYRDFSVGHPTLGGVPVSFNSLAVVFVPGTTVGEANVILQGIGAGISGGIKGSSGVYEGVLALKIPATTHAEMVQALSSLRAEAKVALAVQDALLALDFTPKANGGTPPGWTWENPPSGANWNLERIRAPQMWNLNAALGKLNRSVPTLVIDKGFPLSHPDLDFAPLTAFVEPDMHGTHVAGILGAKFDNGAGIDGVNPFASLQLYEYVLSGTDAGSGLPPELDRRLSVFDAVVWTLLDLIRNNPGARVLNLSIGYNWSAGGIDSQVNTDAQLIADTQGKILADALANLSLSRPLPAIVVSAGNDSYGAAGIMDQFAVYNSPMSNAAINHGIGEIIVVEAVENAPGVGDGEAARCFFSNLGGHVSAPGLDIWSLLPTGAPYGQHSGTSMASPHVAGLAGFLFALDPALTAAEVKSLILSNARDIPEAAHRIDAWASAVDIDRLRANSAVLRMLCDIDDGTADGNLRLFLKNNTAFTDTDADADGGRGDGAVDMSDFRRWRDALHQVQGAGTLDGAANHVKRDLNGDGRVEGAALENVYPFGDFNGDGRVSAADAGYVPGAVGAQATDLDVLKSVFNDPDYDAGDLGDLVNSADIAFDMRSYLRLTGGGPAWIEIVNATDGTPVDARACDPSDSVQVFTLPVSGAGYRARVLLDGPIMELEGLVFSAALCGDDYVRPVGMINLDPKGTFLRACGDVITDPAILDLVELGIEPGDKIRFTARGSYWDGLGTKPAEAMGVFSSTTELLGANNQFRVPGAINAGDEYEHDSWVTWFCDMLPTDIPQDFLIMPAASVVVPAGAKYLFIGALDSYYADNSDSGGFMMELTVLRR